MTETHSLISLLSYNIQYLVVIDRIIVNCAQYTSRYSVVNFDNSLGVMKSKIVNRLCVHIIFHFQCIFLRLCHTAGPWQPNSPLLPAFFFSALSYGYRPIASSRVPQHVAHSGRVGDASSIMDDLCPVNLAQMAGSTNYKPDPLIKGSLDLDSNLPH